MNLSRRYLFVVFIIAALLLSGCVPRPSVKITHSPVVAKSNETVTFTAELLDDGDGPADVQILVNATAVKTCTGLTSGSTCVFTGGPYTAYEDTTVSYLANATASDGATDSEGYYYFAVTDSNYDWSKNYIPARTNGTSTGKFELLFHPASDYGSFGAFVDDVEDKMYDVLGEQDLIESVNNFDDFNFYIYRKTAASTNNCGAPHNDADTDFPQRNADVILHVANFGDCTIMGGSPPHFTAEGGNTKAFLHECGHGVFGLADEYDGAPSCSTYYFEPANTPNIWDIEADCRAEQTSKGRDPDDCWKFTSCQGGWWGIHALNDGNVMQIGMVNDPWGIESREHVLWWFGQSH